MGKRKGKVSPLNKHKKIFLFHFKREEGKRREKLSPSPQKNSGLIDLLKGGRSASSPLLLSILDSGRSLTHE